MNAMIEPKQKRKAQAMVLAIQQMLDDNGLSYEDAAIVLISTLRNRMIQDGASNEEWILVRDSVIDMAQANLNPGCLNPGQFGDFNTSTN